MAPSSSEQASSAALPEHCFYCFAVIDHELNSHSSSEPVAPFPDDGQEYPLFVTWNIFPHSSLKSSTRTSPAVPRLRGCIGTFEPYPLAQGLAEYASISAFKDRRFSPITASELLRLECGVSLLTGFEECDDYLDWEVGVHGIYIHLPNPALAPKHLEDSASSSSGSSTPAPKSRFSRSSGAGPTVLTATYLPDVIPDQGWTKQEAIDSAIRKAGFNGKITDNIRSSLRVRRYRSEKVERTYSEYVAWKQSK